VRDTSLREDPPRQLEGKKKLGTRAANQMSPRLSLYHPSAARHAKTGRLRLLFLHGARDTYGPLFASQLCTKRAENQSATQAVSQYQSFLQEKAVHRPSACSNAHGGLQIVASRKSIPGQLLGRPLRDYFGSLPHFKEMLVRFEYGEGFLAGVHEIHFSKRVKTSTAQNTSVTQKAGAESSSHIDSSLMMAKA
jgi:hypothetical protein